MEICLMAIHSLVLHDWTLSGVYDQAQDTFRERPQLETGLQGNNAVGINLGYIALNGLRDSSVSGIYS